MNRFEIRDLVFNCATALNDGRGDADQLKISEDLVLLGDGSDLDSLSIVSMIVDVEAAISEACQRDVSLTDDRAMSQDNSPFLTISTLVDYIQLLLNQPE
jgi:acyl carrier protein